MTPYIESQVSRIVEAYGPIKKREDRAAIVGTEEERTKYKASMSGCPPYGSQLPPCDYPAETTLILDNGRRFKVADGASPLEEYSPYQYCLAF